MTQYLILRLYGPLASWGEIAVGESRHSARHPSRSALIGLLAAALGVAREDEEGQQQMAVGYRFGVMMTSFGSPLRDYHTIQYRDPERKEVIRTRRQELESGHEVGTFLSTREYRCDSIAMVAVEALPRAPHPLAAVAAALASPHYVLYLGRKSCPPALPLAPQLVEAETLLEAFEGFTTTSLTDLLDREVPRPWPTATDRRAFRGETPSYFWEDGMNAGMEPSMETLRHDQPLSRRRWQFAARREWVFTGKAATR